MFVAAQQDLGDQDLASFGDVIPQANRWSGIRPRRWQFLNVGSKPGFRKSLVVVGSQNVVTVGGHVEFGIGLSLGRADHAKEFILAELLVAFNGQARHTGLLSLL